jgi:hypothetical protein
MGNVESERGIAPRGAQHTKRADHAGAQTLVLVLSAAHVCVVGTCQHLSVWLSSFLVVVMQKNASNEVFFQSHSSKSKSWVVCFFQILL